MKSGVDIASILDKKEKENQDEEYIDGDGTTEITKKTSTSSIKKMSNSTASLNSEKSVSKDNVKENLEEENGLLKELEATSKGTVKGSLIANYFKSAKRPFTLVFLAVSFILSQLLASAADIWVAYW